MLRSVTNGAGLQLQNTFNYFKIRNLRCQPSLCYCISQQRIPVNYRSRPEIASKTKSYNLICFNKCRFSTTDAGTLNRNEFESVCNETLESLCEYFEEIVEDSPNLKGCDVAYSDGVLTIHFGKEYGTYVINRQTPNSQIWLSSPSSGPKRYDYVSSKKCWIYKHDNKSLHQLLQEEISKLTNVNVNFLDCANAG